MEIYEYEVCLFGAERWNHATKFPLLICKDLNFYYPLFFIWFLHTFKNILKVNKPVYLTALKNIASYEQK